MNKREALIISAWTTCALVPFEEFHKFVQDTLGRPIWTHEFAEEKIWDELKVHVKDEFMDILKGVTE